MNARKILVALDFGPASMHALETACAIARSSDAEVVLFTCCDTHGYAYATEMTLLDVLSSMREEASSRLGAIAGRLRRAGLRARPLVAEGTTHREIVDAARAERADLVVVGTHGRRGLAHAVLGSVAERVVRLADPPVLTVREPYFETRAAAGSLLAREARAAGERVERVLAADARAVPIAAAAAAHFDVAADAFVVEPLTTGPEGSLCGVVSELGAMIDEPRTCSLGLGTPEGIAWRATRRARDAGARLRARPLGEVGGRTVLLVLDRIDDAAVALFGVRSLEALGASRVVVATPLARRAVVDALGGDGVRVFTAGATELDPPRTPYRDDEVAAERSAPGERDDDDRGAGVRP